MNSVGIMDLGKRKLHFVCFFIIQYLAIAHVRALSPPSHQQNLGSMNKIPFLLFVNMLKILALIYTGNKVGKVVPSFSHNVTVVRSLYTSLWFYYFCIQDAK